MRPELFTIPGINLAIPSFGAMVMIGFLGGIFWMTRRAAKAKQDPDLVLNFGFIALAFMVIGARSFYVIHYWDTQFKHQPGQIFNLSSGGFEYYGGLVGAFIPCVLYAMYKRLSLRLWTDLMIPTLLFGMGVGRIGCFLAGCCFGAPCPANLPWAVHFPLASEPVRQQWEHREVTLPAELLVVTDEGTPTIVSDRMAGEMSKYIAQVEQLIKKSEAAGDKTRLEAQKYALAKLRQIDQHMDDYGLDKPRLAALSHGPPFQSGPLHPAQVYSAVGPLLLAWLTNAWFYRRKRHGTVFVLGLTLYAVERFIEESLRTDNPIDTFGLTVSQAISVGIVMLMGAYYLLLRQLPLRSRRALPFVPKGTPKKTAAAASPATAT